MVHEKIYKINGITYNSLDEMPIELRNNLDKDRNWEIDFVEDLKENWNTTQTIFSVETKRYNSIDEAPDELKDKIEQFRLSRTPLKYRKINLTQSIIITVAVVITFSIVALIGSNNLNLEYFLKNLNSAE